MKHLRWSTFWKWWSTTNTILSGKIRWLRFKNVMLLLYVRWPTKPSMWYIRKVFHLIIRQKTTSSTEWPRCRICKPWSEVGSSLNPRMFFSECFHRLSTNHSDYNQSPLAPHDFPPSRSGAIALVEVAIIALTPPNPVTIILEVISIGIALAESIKQQKRYLEQLQHAKSSMLKAISDVDKANGRINEECGKLETSWGHLLENGKRTLTNVNVRSRRQK